MSHTKDDERATAILHRKASGLLALDEALIELADADCATTLAGLIAERIRIRHDAVSIALAAESDEAISVMCRAAGFRMNSYSAVLRMRRRHNKGTDSAPTLALTFFSGLSRPSAERMLPRLVSDLAGKAFGRGQKR